MLLLTDSLLPDNVRVDPEAVVGQWRTDASFRSDAVSAIVCCRPYINTRVGTADSISTSALALLIQRLSASTAVDGAPLLSCADVVEGVRRAIMSAQADSAGNGTVIAGLLLLHKSKDVQGMALTAVESAILEALLRCGSGDRLSCASTITNALRVAQVTKGISRR